MRIQICGSVVVEADGVGIPIAPRGPQGTRLFAYLVARRRRPVSRDELIEALWPDSRPVDPEAALTVVLSKMRAALGGGVVEGRSQLRLSLGDAWIDLEAAEEAIHRAEAAVAQKRWADAWGPARVALHVAERGFLPGQDAPWITERRRSLEEVRARALRCIGAAGLGLGGVELTAAERAARDLVRLLPLGESGHLLLMRVLVARGDVSEALVVFDALRRTLRDELGVAPSAEIRAYHAALLREDPATRRAGAGGRVVEASP
jgi:DNA-binding SARP family transcriptional activator